MAKLGARADSDRERFLTPVEVAEILCVSSATIYKLIKAGEIEHVRVSALIRIPLGALAVYVGEDHGGAS